jgi:von Willebrand factor type A domain
MNRTAMECSLVDALHETGHSRPGRCLCAFTAVRKSKHLTRRQIAIAWFNVRGKLEIYRLSNTPVALFFWLIFSGSVLAQLSTPVSPPANDGQAPVIRVSTQFVVLDALVEDAKTGAPVADLKANDFTVLEDGKTQSISYFTHDQLPLSVVLLFDLTETVQATLKPLAEGAHEMLAHLKPQDEVSVMVFSSHTELLQDFTTDRGITSAAIERAADMKSKEGTFIHEDMYEAVGEALKSTVPQSRRVLVWLTDGTANFENSFTQKTIGKQAPPHLHSREEATVRLLQSGVSVAALIDRSAGTDAFLAAADVSPISFLMSGRAARRADRPAPRAIHPRLQTCVGKTPGIILQGPGQADLRVAKERSRTKGRSSRTLHKRLLSLISDRYSLSLLGKCRVAMGR